MTDKTKPIPLEDAVQPQTLKIMGVYKNDNNFMLQIGVEDLKKLKLTTDARNKLNRKEWLKVKPGKRQYNVG